MATLMCGCERTRFASQGSHKPVYRDPSSYMFDRTGQAVGYVPKGPESTVFSLTLAARGSRQTYEVAERGGVAQRTGILAACSQRGYIAKMLADDRCVQTQYAAWHDL